MGFPPTLHSKGLAWNRMFSLQKQELFSPGGQISPGTLSACGVVVVSQHQHTCGEEQVGAVTKMGLSCTMWIHIPSKFKTLQPPLLVHPISSCAGAIVCEGTICGAG